MTGIWLPLAATALAAALTYVCCIRPTRRHGNCSPAGPERTAESVDGEIRRTREELHHLREQASAQERSDHLRTPARSRRQLD
ncbi:MULTISPECIES: hypothetical protein [Streptomyces]|uniref:Secreted protein n=1 Tax=Streptomyces dengpaensis TaxID=2049881 RepID=A0ABM6T1Q9_9ACTN|nr:MULTISPECIES: hypothetical protein [Streptomyces]AVH60822.1 hypothetical protein C4B68_39450 [Streptomyces dengpaensis]PIB03955.1 hypothetical protein B1C81_34880 [Streptomyces sp. HG99]